MKTIRAGWLLAVGVSALSGPGAAEVAAADLVIRNVTVVDVEDGKLLVGRHVVCSGGRIEQLLDASQGPAPRADRTIDGEGLFLLPGLIDAHVHYGAGAEMYGPMLVANGVTFVRDTGSETSSILALRDQLARGELVGPEMIATGAIVDGDPPIWPFSEACSSEEDAREAVRRLHAAGADQIKVYSKLERPVYQAAIDEAHALDLKAVGHVPAGLGISAAIEAGQDGVEHLSGFDVEIGLLLGKAPAAGDLYGSFSNWFALAEVDPAKLDEVCGQVAASGMAHCPTLVVMEGIAQVPAPETRDPELLRYAAVSHRGFWESGQYDDFGRAAKQALPRMISVVRALHRAGATLMAGTDLANPFVYAGFSLHRELVLLQEAGLSPADVLRAATVTPARFFGVEERYGSVAVGKNASLVLLSADPLADARNVAQIEGVVHRGEFLDRAALDEMLAGVREAVAASAPRESVEVPIHRHEVEDLGELIMSGRLKMKFMAWDAGHEEFAIWRNDDGFRLRVKSRPQGGPQSPFNLEVEADEAYRFRNAIYTELGKKPLQVTYSALDSDGSGLVARATRDGELVDEVSVEVGEEWMVDAPVHAALFLLAGEFALEPGERTERTSISFGHPDWKPSETHFTLARQDDEELETEGGMIPARRYWAMLDYSVGEIESDIWTDERGVVLKYVMKLPVGSLTATLAEADEG